MSEYWVSKKKYYCQYCEIYIADDVPSRSQHENGLRHKGNKDRFIRGLYKTGIKKKQESEEEKREMKRVEEAAQAAYARDVGSGLVTLGATSSSSAVPVAPSKPKPPPKPSDPYANYTTAASLGFTDPDIERLVADAEKSRSEGRIGDWIAVVPPPPPLPQDDDKSATDEIKLEAEASVGEVRKREEGPIDDDDDVRRFKMRKKTMSAGLGEIYDPGIITFKPRADPQVTAEAKEASKPGPVLGGDIPQSGTTGQTTVPGPEATEKPVWTQRSWKWAGEAEPFEKTPQITHVGPSHSDPPADGAATAAKETVEATPGDTETQLGSKSAVKDEPVDTQVPLGSNVAVKDELTEPQASSGGSSGGSLFRKRRIPGNTSTRGQRQF